jgi:deoxyribonuclease-4
MDCSHQKVFSAQEKETVLLGAHFSIGGGLHKALITASQYGCPAVQVFTKNAHTWKERSLTEEEIARFKWAKEAYGIQFVCSHGGYLINLASPDPETRRRSAEALAQERIRSSQLGIPWVIIHPGAHMGAGIKKGLRRIAESINLVFEKTPRAASRLLLETTAGQGTSLGHTFEQMAAVSELVVPQQQIGWCLDTCHVFAAGYDLRTKKAYKQTMATFEKTLGLGRLQVIHVNDAKKGLGSRVDRHEHIGEGAMGIDPFRWIMNDARLRDIPKILETPKGDLPVDQDGVNLKRLLSLVRK